MTSDDHRPRCVVAVRAEAGASFERDLPEGSARIGRAPDCEIHVVDDALSRHHARLVRRGTEVVLQDLGSRNGTFVNGQAVAGSARVRPGDVIRAGGAEIRLRWVSPVSLEGEGGSPVGPASVVLDATLLAGAPTRRLFTDLAEENRALTVLTRAGALLIGRDPLSDTLDAILDLCLEAFSADRAAVALLSSEASTPDVAAAKERGKPTNLRVSRAVARAVVAERKALAVTDVEGDPRVSTSESVRIQGVRALACAPLWDGSRVSGLLYVDRRSSGGDYRESDVRLLSLLANAVALRIENARLLEEALETERLQRELSVARSIQQGLMPAGPLRIEGLDVHGTCRPCTEIGGDFFDYFTLPSGRLALVVADVCGKGVSGALVASGLQASLRGGAHVEATPAARLRWLHEHVARAPAARFVTAVLAEVDGATGDVVFARAGHQPPVLLRNDGSTESLAVGGPPLGLLGDTPLEDGRASLAAGDRLILTTDGIVEAAPAGRREPAFGTERLVAAVAGATTARAACDAVFEALERHVDGSPLKDDATVVVLARAHGGPSPDEPHDPLAVTRPFGEAPPRTAGRP